MNTPKKPECVLMLAIYDTGVRKIVKKVANRIDSSWGDTPGSRGTLWKL